MSAEEDALNNPDVKAKIIAELTAIAEKHRGDTKWKEIEEPGASCKAVSAFSKKSFSCMCTHSEIVVPWECWAHVLYSAVAAKEWPSAN